MSDTRTAQSAENDAPWVTVSWSWGTVKRRLRWVIARVIAPGSARG